MRSRYYKPGIFRYFRGEWCYFIFQLSFGILQMNFSFHLILLEPFENTGAELLLKLMNLPKGFALFIDIWLASKIFGMFFNSPQLKFV